MQNSNAIRRVCKSKRDREKSEKLKELYSCEERYTGTQCKN